jgi:hypothetical protein
MQILEGCGRIAVGPFTKDTHKRHQVKHMGYESISEGDKSGDSTISSQG